MDQKVLSILLKMGVDEASTKKALALFTDYQKQINSLEAKSIELSKALKEALDKGENADELSKELVVIGQTLARVKKAADDALVTGFKTDVERATEAAKKFNDQLKDAQKNAFLLRDIGEKLGQVGGRIASAGQSVLNPLLGAQSSYLQAQLAIQQAGGVMDESARRWQTAQQEMEASYNRIGAVTTQELLPLIEPVADLVQQIASLIEANPELVKLALSIGVGGVALGNGLQIAGSIAALLGTLKGLGIVGAGGTAAGGAAGAGAIGAAGSALGTVTLMATAVIIGSELGSLIGNAIAAQIYGKDYKPQSIADAAITAFKIPAGIWTEEMKILAVVGQQFGVSADWFNKGVHNLNSGITVLDKVLNGLPLIGDGTPAAAPAPASTGLTAEQLSAFADYQKATMDRQTFEMESEQARTAIVDAQGAERVAMEQANEAERTRALADFARSQARAEEDYYRQRSQAVRSQNKANQRAEEDHQRQMAKLRRDHLGRVDDLERDRDALGLVEEQRNYDQQRSDAEDDYRVATRRRSEDWADQLAQMDFNYQLQNSRRQEDFDLRLAEMDAQHAAEMIKWQANADARLKAFDVQNAKELVQLHANETNRYNILRAAALNDQSATQNAAARLTTQYRNWLQTQMNLTSGSMGSRAGGGYTNSDGLYRMAEGNKKEFTFDNSSTLAAERMLGGSLTQDALLRTIARGNKGSGSLSRSASLSNKTTFVGAFSDAEKAAMRKMTERAAERSVTRMLGLEDS
jgi:hypothetical protein